MAKDTYIDWQQDSMLVATASGRPNNVSLGAVRLKSLDEGMTAKRTLAETVDELGLAKSSATVILSRGSVEVRTISVPRIDPDELPDVIRFQAQRQLANMGDSWALDYVLLPDAGEEMLTALVGAVAPTDLAGIEAACNEAGLQLARVALRPIEIARYALANSNASGNTLVVCVGEENADLILLKNDELVLLRNTRIPHDSEGMPKVLGGEIRRSLIAASTQLNGAEINQVTLVSASSQGQQLQQAIAEATSTQVELIDIASVLPSDLAGRNEMASKEANRIAGICGAVGIPTAEKATTVDFKNPKKRPPKKSNTLAYVLGGVAAAVLLLAGVSWWYKTNQDLDDELERLAEDNKNKKALLAVTNQKVADLNLVEQFTKSSPNFLNEFANFAEKIPDAEKIILAGPSFSTMPNGHGKMTVRIAADSASTISDFEDRLRDKDHIVSAREPRLSRNPTDLYKWEATENVVIQNRGWDITAPTPKPTSDKAAAEEDSTSETEVSDADESAEQTQPAPAEVDKEGETAAATDKDKVAVLEN